MPLKLYYWSFKGRGINIKTLLKYFRENYQEVTLTRQQWPALKQSFLDAGFNFPNLPMIEDGDYKLSESMAVLTYLAETRGDGSLAGKNPQDQATLRQLEGVLLDLVNMLLKCVFTGEYKTKLQEVKDNQKILGIIQRLETLFSDGRQFALGYFTVADICISNTYRMIYQFFKSAEVDNPLERKILYDHAVRVGDLPGIKEFFASDDYKNTPYFPMPWVKQHPLTAPAN